jgi:hypothetical protein
LHDDGLWHFAHIDTFLTPKFLQLGEAPRLVNQLAQAYPTFSDRTDANKLTDKQWQHGSSVTKYAATTSGMNPLEILHVKLGHVSQELLYWVLRNPKILKGLGYDMNDVKGHTLGLCHACMLGRMKAFPVPASISNKVYGIFELLSVDIVPMNKTSIRGFNYIALFVDKATSMPIMVLMKSKTELLAALQYVISHYGPQRNPRCVHLRFMQSDSGSEQLSNEFLSYLDTNDIKLLLGAPYKKQQQLIERYVQSVRDGLRTALAYNNTPYTYWDYASEYYVYTFSRLPRMGHLTSRHEQFYGEVPDVSHMVPFYSEGYHSISSEERESFSTVRQLLLKHAAAG